MQKQKSDLNVEQIEIKLLTRKKMNELSSGEIKQEGLPEFIKGDGFEFKLADDGLFSEKIFGYSPFTKRGKEMLKSNYGFDERKQRFGHINTCLYINPLLYKQQGNVLQKLLVFARTVQLTNIINYKSYLIYIPNTSEDSLIRANGYALNLSCNVSFLIPPGGLKGKFLTFSMNNLSKGKSPNVTMIRDFEAFKKDKDVVILTGAYAILFLLYRMDFRLELGITQAVINRLKAKIESSLPEVSTKDKNVLDILVSRYNVLKNFLEGGIRPIDLINDRVLVIPAGWRDISMVKDKSGNVKPNKPSINKKYADILNTSMSLRKTYPSEINLDEIFANKNDSTWTKKISILDSNFRQLCLSTQDSIKDLFDKDIVNTLAAKEGKIRQKVLSKRLDFTGRSVITPDPQLELDEIGIPMGIILEFYKTRIKRLFSQTEVYNNIIKRYISNEIKTKFSVINIDTPEDLENGPKVKLGWDTSTSITNEIELIDVLKSIISEHRVINIRFPSLHRYSALGFKMKIVFDNTIHFHPLVCTPYNADFDGDTMSIYLIETREAVKEIDEKMLPSKNLLDSNGQPFILPTQDAILGAYYLTLKPSKITSYKDSKDVEQDIRVYEDYDDMYKDYILNKIGIHTEVTVKLPNYKNSLYNRNYHDWFIEREFLGEEIKYKGVYYDELARDGNERLSLGKVYKVPEYICTPEEYVTSTVGRFIMNTVLPQDVGYVDREKDPYGLEMDKYLDNIGVDALDSKNIKKFVRKIIATRDVTEVKFILDNIKKLGYHYATKSGMSMTLQDLYSHPDKTKIVNEAQAKVNEVEEQLKNKMISESVAKDKKIEIWSNANEELTDKLMSGLEADNPVKMMSVSGSRGNVTQIAQLMGMRGLMANTSGDVIETPVTSSFLDGLSMPELFISTYGARKGIFDRSNRTKETGAFTRTVVYGNSNIIITEGDCGDDSGYLMKPLMNRHEEGKIDKQLGDRVYGKITLEDIIDADGNVVLKKGQLIEREHIELINERYSESGIRVRTPMTCKSKRGLCAKCYGKHLGLNRFSKVGDAVGIIASHTIGEPGTQLTMRTFHTGGVAKGDVTKGFGNISSVVETSKHEELIEDLEVDVQSKQFDEIDKVRQKVKDNILRYKDIEDKLIESYPFSFEDFGIICSDDYIEMEVRLKEEMQEIFLSNGIDVSDTHFELTVRSMGERFQILDPGDSVYEVMDYITWNKLVTTNIGMILKGKNPVIVTPAFQSLQAKVISKENVFLSINYQRLKNGITNAISQNSKDNLLNPMLSVTVGNKFVSPETIGRFKNILDEDKDYENIETKSEMLDRLNVNMYSEGNIDWTDKKSVDKLESELKAQQQAAEDKSVEKIDIDNMNFNWSQIEAEENITDTKTEESEDNATEKSIGIDDKLDLGWITDVGVNKSDDASEESGKAETDIDILKELSKITGNDVETDKIFVDDDSVDESDILNPFSNVQNEEKSEDEKKDDNKEEIKSEDSDIFWN